MKGRQTALMPGNEDKVGYWLTPAPMMAELQAEFDFDFDAAPYPRPAGFDGLKEPWGQRTWCNPPIGRGFSLTDWAKKAVHEASKGRSAVVILPVWFSHAKLLEAGAEVRYVGNVEWASPDRRKKGRSNKFPFALFILRPKP